MVQRGTGGVTINEPGAANAARHGNVGIRGVQKVPDEIPTTMQPPLVDYRCPKCGALVTLPKGFGPNLCSKCKGAT